MTSIVLPDGSRYELRGGALSDAGEPPSTTRIAYAAAHVVADPLAENVPGAPAVLPGEVITREVLDYARSGLAAGMQIPDPVDSELKSVRVVAK